MDNNDKLNNYAKERKYYDKENREHASKDRFRNCIEKHIKTLFIGIISDLEKDLGELWGHGLLTEELNDFELDNKAIWKLCRSKILDKGNDAIRSIIKELDNYTVDLKKHTLVFKVKKDSGGD